MAPLFGSMGVLDVVSVNSAIGIADPPLFVLGGVKEGVQFVSSSVESSSGMSLSIGEILLSFGGRQLMPGRNGMRQSCGVSTVSGGSARCTILASVNGLSCTKGLHWLGAPQVLVGWKHLLLLQMGI